MTDFLRSLAARSLGQEAVVQPRPRALFKPEGRIDPETDLEQEVEIAAEPPAARRPARPTPRAAAARASREPVSPPSPETPAAKAAAAPRDLHVPAAPHVAPSLEPLETDRSEREHDVPVAEVTPAPRHPARPPVDPTRLDGRPVELVPVTVAPAGGRLRPRSRATPTRLARPIADGLVETTESEAPIVRVTIGRVDVRAVVTPPEPPLQAPSKPSRMTLEEYLARGAKP